MDLITLFGYPFYRSKCVIKKNIIKTVKNLEYYKDQEFSYISKNNYILELEELSNLKKEISKVATDYFRNTLRIVDKINMRITTSWAVKHCPGGFASSHFHSNSMFSGVVYLETTKDSGTFTVYTPNSFRLIDLQYEEFNHLNSQSWWFLPENNDIYIFPSELPHQVSENKSSEDRYCVAFNFFPEGTSGYHLYELKL